MRLNYVTLMGFGDKSLDAAGNFYSNLKWEITSGNKSYRNKYTNYTECGINQ